MRCSMERLLFAVVSRPAQRWLAQFVNWTRGTTGWRWPRRFFSFPLNDPYSATAVRYVEPSPVQGGLVGKAESFLWATKDGAGHAVKGGRAGCGTSSPAGTGSFESGIEPAGLR